MVNKLVELVLLGFACGFFSYTLAVGDIFNPVRDFFFHKTHLRGSGKYFTFLHKLFSCAYCVSHWVAFFMCIIWRPVITDCGIYALDFVVSVFILVGISSLSWSSFERFRDG